MQLSSIILFAELHLDIVLYQMLRMIDHIRKRRRRDMSASDSYVDGDTSDSCASPNEPTIRINGRRPFANRFLPRVGVYLGTITRICPPTVQEIEQVLLTDSVNTLKFQMDFSKLSSPISIITSPYPPTAEFSSNFLLRTEYTSRFSHPNFILRISDFTAHEQHTATDFISRIRNTRTMTTHPDSHPRIISRLLVPFQTHSIRTLHTLRKCLDAWKYAHWTDAIFMHFCFLVDTIYALSYSNNPEYGYIMDRTSLPLQRLHTDHTARIHFMNTRTTLEDIHWHELVILIKTTPRIDDIVLMIASHIPLSRARITATRTFMSSKSWFRDSLTPYTPTEHCQKAIILERISFPYDDELDPYDNMTMTWSHIALPPFEIQGNPPPSI